MNNFEESLLILLKDCKELLKPQGRYTDDISRLSTYQACQIAFENDNGFKDAARLAGFWGTFNAILEDIINKCCRIRGDKVIIDTKCVLKTVAEFRKDLLAKNVHYTGKAILLGVNLNKKKIIIDDGLILYRLNKKEMEREERRFYIEDLFSKVKAFQILSQPTEIHMTLKLPVNRSMDSAFFNSFNEAQMIATEAFVNIVDSILLIKNGIVKLGPCIFKGGLTGGPLISGFDIARIPNENVEINKSDIPFIIKAYDLISGKSQEKDRVLLQALHRYIIGRKRDDLADKLIDYTISWESLLLSQKKSQTDQELSYRFSVNGSSLLSTIHRNKNNKEYFKKMRCIYSLRSSIVHGGDPGKIDKKIKDCQFGNLKDICEFLENNFKAALLWLIGMKPNNRPYNKEEGWEDLLWK
jgi:hypothetical protein